MTLLSLTSHATRVYRFVSLAIVPVVLLASSVAKAEPTKVGNGDDAMPAVGVLGVAAQQPGAVGISGTAGYGYTEAQTPEDSSHHRVLGKLAASLSATQWLQLALKLDGRYDKHGRDDRGSSDSGMVGEPTLSARALFQDSGPLLLGAQLDVLVPGQNAPSVDFAALTPSVRLLAALRPANGNLTVASQVGFRLDRSSESAPNPAQLRRGDRIALGVSEFNSVPLGLGVSYRLSQTELLSALSADLLLGAPSISQSPMRGQLGMRHHLSAATALEVMGNVALSSRPSIAVDAPLIPIEPRYQIAVGLRFALGMQSQDHKPKQTEPEEQTTVKETLTPKPEKPKATAAMVKGRIVDQTGTPLAQVEVTLEQQGKSFSAVTDDKGQFTIGPVPFGEAKLKYETVDFQVKEVKVTVSGDGQAVKLPDAKLEPTLLGAQIQGLVRAFSGEPLVATVTIDPGKTHTTGEDGRFAIDIEPGKYTVTIAAPGYVSQTRTFKVEKTRVIVFNADLRKK